MSSRKPSFLSLFAGCGGFDLGFTAAGYRCVAAFDADDTPLSVHRNNLHVPVYCQDLSGGNVCSFPSKHVDVIVAGPPCQGFSTAGKRNPEDPRNHLLSIPANIAARVSARVVVVENVLGVTAGNLRQHWDKLVRQLRYLGYRTCEIICNASEHGVPQDRRRVLLMAWNTGDDLEVKLTKTTGGVLADALANLDSIANHEPKLIPTGSEMWKVVRRIQPGQKLCNVRSSERSIHTWEIPEVYGSTTQQERKVLEAILRLRRRNRLRETGDADPVTCGAIGKQVGRVINSQLFSLQSKGYIRRIGKRYDLVHTFNGKFRRLPPNKPAPTVDTRFGDPRYFVHPTEHRGFTVREAARLQGFPDHFIFSGTSAAQFRMIGNAVPPPLATSVASFIRDAILKK